MKYLMHLNFKSSLLLHNWLNCYKCMEFDALKPRFRKKYVIALILSSVEMVSLRYDIYSNNVILL